MLQSRLTILYHLHGRLGLGNSAVNFPNGFKCYDFLPFSENCWDYYRFRDCKPRVYRLSTLRGIDRACDRAHRIGQTRVVTAYKLIARDTVEEKIVKLQARKRALSEETVGSEEPLMSGITTEDLAELLG